MAQLLLVDVSTPFVGQGVPTATTGVVSTTVHPHEARVQWPSSAYRCSSGTPKIEELSIRNNVIRRKRASLG